MTLRRSSLSQMSRDEREQQPQGIRDTPTSTEVGSSSSRRDEHEQPKRHKKCVLIAFFVFLWLANYSVSYDRHKKHLEKHRKNRDESTSSSSSSDSSSSDSSSSSSSSDNTSRPHHNHRGLKETYEKYI